MASPLQVVALSWVFTVLVIVCRMVSFVTSPLWLDSLNPSPNITVPKDTYNVTFPFFLMAAQNTTPILFWAPAFLLLNFACPRHISAQEHEASRLWMMFPAAAQALSSTLINYALSGQRTPLYLQALLTNFSIPMQFTVRFLILRKRPTLRKLLCACTVMGAELVCLLPSIFPQLEPSTAHKDEGGASGPGRILFPLLLVSSNIPYTIANVIMERSVQAKAQHHHSTPDPSGTGPDDHHEEQEHMNMVYYQFWYSLSMAVTSWLLFWVDIIPGFGSSPSITVFAEKLQFNFECLVGSASSCGTYVCLLAWSAILSNALAYTFVAYLLRYSEGANFFVVVMALRSPLLFLFWTLFKEPPFHWHPETHLSTWLSIGALVLMVPAVILYNSGALEKTMTPHGTRLLDNSSTMEANEYNDRRPLLDDQGSFSADDGHIQTKRQQV